MSAPSNQLHALSFDGCGINGADVYRSRIATFVQTADLKTYGPLFAASPLLLAALIEAQELLAHNKIDTGPLPGVSQRIRYAIASASPRSAGGAA